MFDRFVSLDPYVIDPYVTLLIRMPLVLDPYVVGRTAAIQGTVG